MHKNLAQIIKERISSNSKMIFIENNQDKEVFYSQIYDRALNVLYQLQQNGIKEQDKLILITEKNEDFVYLFWACILGNIVPVPVIPRANQEGINTIIKIWLKLDRPFIATNMSIITNLRQMMSTSKNDTLAHIAKKFIIYEQIQNKIGIGKVHEANLTDTALLQFSSGSTGDPKGVVLSHENLLSNTNSTLKAAKISKEDISLSWMPLTHDMGLIGFHLTPIIVDCNHYLMDPMLFLKNPLLWLEKANEYKVTTLVSPNFGYKHVLRFIDADKKYKWNFENVRLIFNGAEPISMQYCNMFLKALSNYNLSYKSMFAVYGLAEATLAVSFNPVGEGLKAINLNRHALTVGQKVKEVSEKDKDSVTFVDLGYALEDCEVRICNKNTVVDENTIGVIQIRGKSITSGYYKEIEKTKDMFTDDGWLITGDLGFIRNDRLIVTGREKDIIFINGQNYYPEDIERVITNIVGFESLQVATVGVFNEKLQKDDIIIFVQFDKNIEDFLDIRKKIKRLVNKRTSLDIIYVIPIKEIPKTVSGKVQRYKMAKSFTDGKFVELIQKMNGFTIEEVKHDEKQLNAVTKKLICLYRDVLGVNNVNIEDSFFELGGNSLKAMELILKINKHFNVNIQLNELLYRSTIIQLEEYIKNSDNHVSLELVKAEKDEYYPALPSQQRLYVLNQLDNKNTNYNLPVALEINSDYNHEKFTKALDKLVARHEALRTTFHLVNNQLMQKIHQKIEYDISYADDVITDIQETIHKFVKPFDLSSEALFRVKIARLKNNNYLLIIDFHHIITDGSSMGVLIRDLASYYNDIELPKIKYDFKDFCVFKNKSQEQHWHKEQQKYWCNLFKDEIPVLNLPLDYARPMIQSFKGDVVTYNVDRETTKKLREYAKSSNSTLYMIMLSAYYVLLNRYTNQEEIIVGTPVAGRYIEGLENTMGMFINTLPIRSKIDRSKSFTEFLEEVKDNFLMLYKYQGYQIEELLKELNIYSDLSRNPLFDTVFNMLNMDIPSFEVEGMKSKLVEYNHKTSKLDLTFEAEEIDEVIRLKFEYCTDLFHKDTIYRLINHYVNILENIIKNENILIKDINVLSKEEFKLLTIDFNNTDKDSYNVTVNELLERIAKQKPDNIAIIDGNDRLTYKQLVDKINSLASTIRTKGVKRNDIVGIMVKRGFNRIIGMLAILKAGGAYLPIEPEFPLERTKFMLKDSNTKLLLVDSTNTNMSYEGIVINVLDEIDKKGSDIRNINELGDLAYIIYTSGTTGNPKGIMVEHKNLMAYVKAFEEEFSIDENERVLQQASYSFDAFVEEVYPSLLNGSTLVLTKKEEVQDIELLSKVINKNQVTIVSCSPPLLDELNKYKYQSIHTYLCGGDVMKYDNYNNLIKYANVYNTYGPTETTVCATYYKCEKTMKSNIPIGKPIANYKTYILDSNNNLQPIGVPGELCISGRGVTRGYLNRAKLTAQKYIKSPFKKDEVLYKTGDLARWLEDGNIEYLGRIDNQVNIRGFRIELAEVENQLLKLDYIKKVIVIDMTDSKEKYLCAYIVSDKELVVSDIRDYLVKYLPDYMIPSYFIQIDEIPINNSGKVDRKLLSEIKGNIKTNQEFIKPTNEIENRLSKIWQEILDVNPIGINDNFFDLGGHSLKATALVSQIYRDLGVKVPLKEIFRNTTIKKLGEYINKATYSEDFIEIVKQEKRDYYKASSVQKRLIAINQMDTENTSYNITRAVEIKGDLDLNKINRIFRELIERHESLRTSFDIVNDDIVQIIHDNYEFVIKMIELGNKEINEIVKDFVKPFDLHKSPLMRVALVKVNEYKHVMIIDIHHVISDGISISVLIKEFFDLYKGCNIQEVKLHYKDFAAWQNKMLDSKQMKSKEEFWLKTLKTDVEVLDILTDFPRPKIQNFEGSCRRFKINENLTRRLKVLCEKSETTLYMVLLSAYNILLSKYSHQEDIIVGSPIGGRYHPDLESMVGMFVNTVAMRNYPKADKRFVDFLEEVKQNSLDAFENQQYPFEELVEKLKIKRDLSRNPLFDTMFIMQNMQYPDMNTDDLKISIVDIDNDTTMFDITLEIKEDNNYLDCILEYSASLYKASTIDRLKERFVKVLTEITLDYNVKIADINILKDDERQLVIKDFQGVQTPYKEIYTIKDLFENQVAKTPYNVALVYQGENITYDELSKRANKVAHMLRNKGIKTKDVVGIMMPRSFDMIVGILGIIKSGATYLPIDINYPNERIKNIIEDCKPKVILLKEENMTVSIASEICHLDCIQEEKQEDLVTLSTAGDLLYIIYTSGTTGKPKGIQTEHRNVISYIKSFNKLYNINENSTTLLQASMTFDGFVEEVFTVLTVGGKLVIPEDSIVKEAHKLRELIVKNNVSILSCSPFILSQFNSLEPMRCVDVFLSSSDVLKKEYFGNIIKYAKVYNMYGPTEGTVCSTYYKCSDNESEVIPIGRPIPNYKVYILDEKLKAQPIGIKGDIYIGGKGVARGYHNRKKLTHEKFIKNPYDNELMYKTGDIGRWLDDGNIEFFGRIDKQVKIRGYRIEIGAIESKLLKHDAIKEAVVLANEEVGDKYLCAYVVSNSKMTVKDFREHLLKTLPDYMVPSYFVVLDKLPLNHNGKIDKESLPSPSKVINTGVEYVMPTNDTEKVIADIWKENLKLDKVSINDDFFELGGHSLKATIMAAKINKIFKVKLSINDIFKYSTIAKISEYIANMSRNSYEDIQLLEKSEYYDVSSSQRRLYTLWELDQKSISYNMPSAVLIEGCLNKELLDYTVNQLIERHETLRTSFHIKDDKLVQKVHTNIPSVVTYLKADEEVDINKFIKPFELSKAPLFRVIVIKIAMDKHIVMFDMHHIVSDGMSVRILLKEFASIYKGEKLPQNIIQYKEFAHFQNKYLQTDDMIREEKYWLDTLKGEIKTLDIVTDYPRPKMQSYVGKTYRFKIDKKTTMKLRELSKDNKCTMFMILLAVYNVMLSKYSSQDDIIVGTPISGRIHGDVENVVGMFVNTLALRNFPKRDMSFIEFLENVKVNAFRAFENQNYQFEQLIDKLSLRRDLSRNPVFDVMFSMLNMENTKIDIEDFKCTEYQMNKDVSKFDLTLLAEEVEDTVSFEIEYCSELFKKQTIITMADHFKQIINSITDNPNRLLKDIDMITEKEIDIIMNKFNNTKIKYQRELTINQLFDMQVRKTPNNIAIVCGKESITYREVSDKANILANDLIEKGVKNESTVGILVDRSIEMIISMLAVLKAGGAYLPIDTDFPKERIKYMIEDSKTQILIISTETVSFFDDIKIRNYINVDEVDFIKDIDIIDASDSSRLAYVIYTSGSTGKPKGVMIEHKTIHNFIVGMMDRINFDGLNNILSLTTISFDIFVLESLLPLTKGLKVILANKKESKSSRDISNLIVSNKVECLQLTPSRLRMILSDDKARESLSNIKVIVVGGEVFSRDILTKLKSISKESRIYNMYGPTETTVWSTTKDLTNTHDINIGTPIANTNVLILDKSNNMVPIGVKGELCIGGECLARGYLYKEELTKEKFIEHSICNNNRIYKTGDQARWLHDGCIEFLGRIDTQVKIRGYRIELGEIESRLLKHEDINEAVVVVRTDKVGEQYICSYIVSSNELTISNIREFLALELPSYMLPSYYIKLDKLPLTPNGKLDRNALPEPQGEIDINSFQSPRDNIEIIMQSIWQELLDINKIGINDNFFEIGGHSLKATLLINKISKELKVDVPLEVVFSNPTIKEITEYIKKNAKGIYSPIQRVSEREYYPLSSSQMRMFILNDLERSNTNYNIPMALTIEGNIDKELVKNSFIKLISRHESLRTSFKMIDNTPVQVISKYVDFELEYAKSDFNEIKDIINQYIRPFDISKAPLFRAMLIEVKEDEHVLVIDMHHIVSDGMSISILLAEFAQLYNKMELKPIKTQYKDFAIWQKSRLKSYKLKIQENYWKEVLKKPIPVLNMMTDYQRPAMQSFEGDCIDFRIDNELKQQLYDIAIDNNCTLYMVLLASYNVLLYKYSSQEDIIVGSPIAGRVHEDIQKTVGTFVNTLIMRNAPKGSKTFTEFLREVKESSIGAFKNQDYQFEELVKKLDLSRDTSRNPIFDTMFILQNMDRVKMELDSLKVDNFNIDDNTSRLDMILTAMEDSNGITFNIEYCVKLFKKETIDRLSNHFVNILKSIVEEPNLLLANIDIISKKEETKLIDEFNSTFVKHEDIINMKQLFENQAMKTPNSIALVYKDSKITYSQLNERANKIANDLITKGVGKDRLVGVLLDRSLEMVIAIVGVLKSGGAYLPIDINYPDNRISYILKDSNTNILISTKELMKSINLNNYDGEIIDINIIDGNTQNPDIKIAPNALAYTIYTSGSTGKPKGVMIEHRNFYNFNNAITKHIDFSSGKSIGLLTTVSFDLSIFEMLIPLINGVKVVIASNKEQKNPYLIKDMIIRNNIDMLSATPARLRAIIEIDRDLEFTNKLREIMIGGDSFPSDLLDTLQRKTDASIYNLYGPTESTVWATVKNLSEDTHITIGRPLNNIQIYILDSDLRLVPIGVAGEICIAGDSLGRGYHNNKTLTDTKFVANHINNKGRLYKSGDLGRWLPNGEIEFLGRVDNQVKIRGYRIEISEIENQILSYNDVKDVVVIENTDISYEKYLCGYIVKSNDDMSIADIREYLSDYMPEYMIPSYFVFLDSLPLSPNGKIDRKLLPDPIARYKSSLYEKPENKEQEMLVSVFKEVLGIDNIGINDNFFEMGGQSLKAIQISSLLKKANINTNISDIFKYQTIKKLSQALDFGSAKAKLSDETEIENKILQQINLKCKYVYKNVEEDIYKLLVVERSNHKDIQTLNKFISDEVHASSQPHYIVEVDDLSSVNKRKLLNLKKGNEIKYYYEVKDEILKKLDAYEANILRNRIKQTYIISSVQRAFLASKAIYTGIAILLKEYVDISLLNESILKVINKHSLLRSALKQKNDRHIWDEREDIIDIQVPFIDLSIYEGMTRTNILKNIISDFYYGKYNNQGNILYRILVIKENNKLYHIRVALHHSIFDEMSGQVIEKDILDYYRKLINGDKILDSHKNYNDYIKQINRGPINITEEDIIEKYRLDEFSKVNRSITNLIGKNKLKSFLIDFDMRHADITDNTQKMFELSVILLEELGRRYFNTDTLPMLMFYYGRNYQEQNYYDYVGAFVDFIPLLIDFNTIKYDIYSYIEDMINTSLEHNINFVTLSLDEKFKQSYSNIRQLVNPYESIPLMFNYHGSVSEMKMKLNKEMTREYVKREKQMSSFDIQGMMYDVSYTADTLRIILYFPENISNSEIKEILSNKINEVTAIDVEKETAISKE
ncbi:amino acid adenylation domain-containing protein [Clostridiaceae bacterium M8S5]|nr:amino acid adenylation domain-containing protein [Clostridiaceae bacterium M8S5]